MPFEDTYIQDSLEINLFFLRIMKEHALFLQMGFPPKNKDLGAHAENIRMRMDDLLRQTVQAARGYMSGAVMTSGELFTRYTEEAERTMQSLTGVPIDTQITVDEYSMGGTAPPPASMQSFADRLNYNAVSLTQELLQLKEMVYNGVVECSMFTNIYPLMIDHVIREAREYLQMLERLNKKQLHMGPQELAQEEALMDDLMGEHGLFIDGMLDPTETALKVKARSFYPQFHALSKQAVMAERTPQTLPALTRKTVPAVEGIRDFKTQGVTGILSCKVRSIIPPLLADHVLRESNYYLRVLRDTLGMH